MTAEEIWDKNHKHEPTVGWSNLAGGFIEKSVRTDKQRGIDAMREYAKQEVEKAKTEIWNAAIDAAAEGALLTWKVEDWNEPIGYTEREVSSLESSRGEYFEVSKQSILKLKK